MATGRPCQRCGTEPKIPGGGQRYCQGCKDFIALGVMERTRENQQRAYKARQERVGAPRRRMSKDAPEGTKWCPQCCQYLMRSCFGKNASYCKDCDKGKQWSRHIVRKYGITAEQYEALLSCQGGQCAVCGTKPRRKRLAVDHDHKTGFVRGLLCTSCNHRVIGGAKEDASILRKAADYLDKPPAIEIIGEVKADGKA